MAGRRMPRLNEQIRREVIDIVRNEVRDPRIGFVTITRVEAAPDLSLARIFLTVMGEEAAEQETLEGLRAAAPFIRGEIGKRLHVRRTPELRFEIDEALAHSQRIEELLREVRESEQDRAPADEGDEEA